MKVIALKGDLRDGLGKSHTKKLRNEGRVPCVLYGQGDNTHFSSYQADFKNLVYTPNTYLVQLNVAGEQKLAKVQEMQFHPVSEEILHADFFEINPEKPINISVPVKVVGNSPGVRAGGKLQLKIKKLNVFGLVRDLPEFIEVNIDTLQIGKSVKVGDINVEKLQILDAENNSIISCNVTRAARSAGLGAGEAEGDEDGDESEGGEE
jgi:large subunit ribosomal protein L25